MSYVRSHFGSGPGASYALDLVAICHVQMVHCYSAEARQRRRDRAFSLGYIQPRPWGQRYVLVDAVLQKAVKAAYHSLQLHYRHDRLGDTVHHHGREASRHALQTGWIDGIEYEKAARAHKLAGKMKHNVSRQWVQVSRDTGAKDVPDELFERDPWAGKSPERGGFEASSDELRVDPWRPWLERAQEQRVDARIEASESWDGTSVGGILMLVDIVINETVRALVGEVRIAASRIEQDMLTLPSGSDGSHREEGRRHDGEVDRERQAYHEADEHDEFQYMWYVTSFERDEYEHDLQSHLRLLQDFMCEWNRYEQLVVFEAGCLDECVRSGGDDWWNDTLDTAEVLEGYAAVLSGGDTHMSKDVVIEKVRCYLQSDEDESDQGVGGGIELALSSVGLRGNTMHAGAWTLLLGLASASYDAR
jgi:hypothetical protein